jgi:hypothetical protein
MKYETYEKICGKHKINPHQVIADGNIREILERDKDHDLEFHEILLDNYFTVYYWEGKVADI